MRQLSTVRAEAFFSWKSKVRRMIEGREGDRREDEKTYEEGEGEGQRRGLQ